MEGIRLDDRAHGSGRVGQVSVAATADRRVASGRRGEVEHDLHGGGFAGSVRPEEAGDPPGRNGKAEVVYDRGIAVTFCEVCDLQAIAVTGWRDGRSR